jgi:putative membrane protein
MVNKLLKNTHVLALTAFVVVIVISLAYANEQAQSSIEATTILNANATQNSNSSSSKQAGAVSAGDKSFVLDAAMGGMTEVEIGKLAMQQGMSDGVKQFGKTLVDDHSAANAELTQIASAKGITLPTELDAKHRANVTKLSKMSGASFDQAFAKAMVSDHTKDVAKFQRQSTSGRDADIKGFATKTLPTLKNHLAMAKALNVKPATTARKKGN